MRIIQRLGAALLVISLVLGLFTACEEETAAKKRRRPRDDSEKVPEAFSMEDLLGSWSVKTEKFEATLVFREEEEDAYDVTWTVYDFGAEVWSEETYRIKEITGFSLVALSPHGEIGYFLFAPFGQTLYFDGLYYTNPEKNVGLPEDTAKFAFLRDGRQTEVMDGVFLGMTYAELKRSFPSVRDLEEHSYSTCPYTAVSYDVDALIPSHKSAYAHFSFDSNTQLASASLRIYRSEYDTSSYRTLKPTAETWLSELTEAYGEPVQEESTYTDYNDENHVYHTYRWELGNIVCQLKFDGIDTIDNLDGVTLIYSLTEYT